MSVERLPPDNYGVRVMCKDDRVRLLWLANQVGEDALRNSVRRYQHRFIGSMPFVSKMIRWHRLEASPELCALHRP
jgi:hypothetical protein